MDLVWHLKLITLEHGFCLKIVPIEGKKIEIAIAFAIPRFQMDRFRSLAKHAE